MAFSGQYLRDNNEQPKFDLFKNHFHFENFSFQSEKDFYDENDYFVYLWGDILTPEINKSEKKEKVLLDLFNKDRNLFQESIDGLYLLVIFQKSKKQLWIFNGRYLSTATYYLEDKGDLYFSHEMKDMINVLSNQKIQTDFSSVKTFISNGFTSTDQTQLSGIKKLLPTFNINTDGKINVNNHWKNEFQFKREKFQNLESHLDEYERVYQEGIRKFFKEKQPKEVGTLLSGGHDTSWVLIQASQIHDRPIHTFTATFPEWAFDESEFAKRNSEKFGAKFHTVPFLPEDLDYMVELIHANGEPVVGSSLPVHLCAKEAAKHVDVMLAGDGGDTMWGEYYPVAEYHNIVKHLPKWGQKLAHLGAKTLLSATDWERFWELEHVASLFSAEKPYDDFMRKLCTYRHFTDEFQKELFVPELFNKLEPARSSLELEFNKENFSEMLIEGKLFNGFYMYQSFHTNKSMEAYDLPLYLPTIYKPLMDFVTSLPNEWVNGGTALHRLTNNKKINRRFHKKALSRYLGPDEIYNRSFDIPWYNILRPRPELLEKLKSRLKRRGWYQEKTIDKLFNEFMGQKVKTHELLELKHHGYRIFTLLSLEIWCMEFLDKKPGSPVKGKVNLEDYLT